MSKSTLSHGFGIVGYRYKSISYQEGDLVFHYWKGVDIYLNIELF